VAAFPAHDRERSLLLSELGEALMNAGNLTDADATLVEAEADALTNGYEVAVWRSKIAQTRLRQMSGRAQFDEIIATARSAASQFAALDDHLGMARALLIIGFLTGANGVSIIEADRALVQALEHARRANAPREIADAITWSLGNAWFGPTPAHEGIARCRDVLQDPANRSIEANAHLTLGCFLAMRGECQAARASCARGLALLEDLGNTLMHAAAAYAYYDTEMLCGDPHAAELLMRSVCATLEAMGERGFLSTRFGYLAEALYVQGRFDEADVAAGKAEAISDPSDADAQLRWRSVRARLLAQSGDFAAAEALIVETVKLPDSAEMLNDMAAVRLAYAEILELAGRIPEARAQLRDALRLFELKENDVAAARVRARLGRPN
jgi:tetratricopeptide (TPR) repeat protein